MELRKVLFFNYAFKYNYNFKNVEETCNKYGKNANLYSADIPDKNNRFNSWNFEEITIVANDFLSVDKNELAGERGEDGSLPEVNFMKLNPEGPNYEVLKTIEEELEKYEILEDGTIRNKITNENVTNIEDEIESDTNEDSNIEKVEIDEENSESNEKMNLII